MESHLLSALMCLVLLAGAAFAATPATELLYVQQGQNIVAYSVNTTTAVTKKLSTLRTAYSGATKITIKKDIRFVPVSAWLFPNNRILHGLLADDCRKTQNRNE